MEVYLQVHKELFCMSLWQRLVLYLCHEQMYCLDRAPGAAHLLRAHPLTAYCCCGCCCRNLAASLEVCDSQVFRCVYIALEDCLKDSAVGRMFYG
jgi:hypothetical protein